MFGMEEKKPVAKEALFQLEEELSNPNKRKELADLAVERMVRIKELLSSGSDGETVQKMGTLLQGYVAFKNIVLNYKL